MITKDNLLECILKRSDDFKEHLETHNPDWKEEGDYTALAEYARYILSLYKENKEEQIKENFRLIGEVFDEGDQYVKEAVTIGLLETLQNNISWEKDIKGEVFLPLLSEALKNEWKKVGDFWEGRDMT